MDNIHSEEQKTAVLVITRNRLLGDVLAHLLGNEFMLNAYQVNQYAFNRKRLLNAVELYQPAVIILEEDEAIRSFLVNHLSKHGRTRLVFINSQSNQVHVQDCFPVNLTQSAEFYSLLQNDFSQAPILP